MIDKIKCNIRIGNDIHKELIAMWRALQDGWMPPETITEEEYINVFGHRDTYPPYYVGYVGFNGSFGSKYFGGYARGFKNDKVTPRDIPNEAYRNLMKQVPLIKDVVFTCSDFLEPHLIDQFFPNGIVIYCDPPYQGTTKYSNKEAFDYDAFWEWCRQQSKNAYVFVSEYNAPEDFECIWSKDVDTALDVVEHKKRTEKLFVYKYGKYYETYSRPTGWGEACKRFNEIIIQQAKTGKIDFPILQKGNKT